MSLDSIRREKRGTVAQVADSRKVRHMNTSNHNVALVTTISEKSEDQIPYRNLSDKEEEEILTALRVLHKFTYTADRGKSRTELPKWEECGLVHYENICDRTFSALKRKGAMDTQKMLNRVYGGIMSDIETARETEAVAYAEWTQLTDTLKKRFPYTAPKVVEVAVSDTLRHFPKGTTVEQAYSLLLAEGTMSGGGSLATRLGVKVSVPTLPNPAGKGRPISDIGNTKLQAARVPASGAEGSTLPHGNGQRAELSDGQAIAAARAQ